MLRPELLKKQLMLERQLAKTQEELALIARMLELNPEEHQTEAGSETQDSTNERTLYTKMTASEAIIDFLRGRAYQFTTAGEIHLALVAGGMRSTARRFANVVYNELDRMVERDHLELGRKDGKKAYRLKVPV